MNKNSLTDVWCKICGITCIDDAGAAVAAGADAIGLNRYPASQRYVDLEQAREIAAAALCTRVALFVNPSEADVAQTLEAVDIDMLQFHGDEAPAFCEQFGLPYMKAVRVRAGVDVEALAAEHASAWALLLDAYVPEQPGGTGERFDWALWPRQLQDRRLVVAGGLTPENVAEAVEHLSPFGVDVAGGVEDEVKGRKNPVKMTEFVARARSAAIA